MKEALKENVVRQNLFGKKMTICVQCNLDSFCISSFFQMIKPLMLLFLIYSIMKAKYHPYKTENMVFCIMTMLHYIVLNKPNENLKNWMYFKYYYILFIALVKHQQTVCFFQWRISCVIGALKQLRRFFASKNCY